MSTCCGQAGPRGLGEPQPEDPDFAPSGPPPLWALHCRPGEGSLAHHAPRSSSSWPDTTPRACFYNATNGCPRGLGVPEQGRGARGCPVRKGQRRSGQRGGRVPSGRSPSPGCQSSCRGSGCSYCPSGLPPTDCPTNPAPTAPCPHFTPQTCLRWLCGSGHGAPGAGQGLTPCALVPCLSSSPVREGAPWDSGTRRWVKIHCMEKFEAR